MIPIVIASHRRTAEPGIWSDLRLADYALAQYATTNPVTVAWKGPFPPVGLYAKLVEQPDEAKTFGAAYNFAISQVEGDCIILNDDVIVLPDTLEKLLEDVAELKRVAQAEPGIVGCRGSMASGVQCYAGYMVRYGKQYPMDSNSYQRGYGHLLRLTPPTERVAPFAAWINRKAFEAVGGLPETDWYGDDAYALLLERAGYGSYMSHAYVFHIGERSSSTAGITQDDLDRAGRAWAQAHFPEVLR